MKERFTTSQWVPFPLDLVFAFFTDPNNLPSLMPARMRTRVDEVRWMPSPPRAAPQPPLLLQCNAAGVGSEIEVTLCPFPLVPVRLRWVARVTEFEWHQHFSDEQIAGPFESFRHRHGFAAEIQDGRVGTMVKDEIEFLLPFGQIARICNGMVRQQMVRTFKMRQKKLPEVLGSMAKRMG